MIVSNRERVRRWVRTTTPALYSGVAVWVGTRTGVDIPEGVEPLAVTALAGLIYAGLARLEEAVPAAGVLLGWPGLPAYGDEHIEELSAAVGESFDDVESWVSDLVDGLDV